MSARGWSKMIGSPWTCVAFCLLTRTIFLLTLFHGADAGLLARHDSSERSSSIKALTYYNRRTELRPLTEDEHNYDEMAANIVAGRGFVLDSHWIVNTPHEPTMYAGCFYPLFVAAVYSVTGSGHELPVFLLQILLHSLAVWPLWQVSRRVGGPLAATLTAGFYALHPTLLWCSAAMMSESITLPFTALLAWLMIPGDAARLDAGNTVRTTAPLDAESRNLRKEWRRCVALAAVLAILCLTRSTCFGLAGISAVVLWHQHFSRMTPGTPGRYIAALRGPIVMLLLFAILCAPWTIRNYIHWHRFIPFSTKSGVNAWFFNHPGQKVEFSRRIFEGINPVDVLSPAIQDLPDEATRDARSMSLFLDFLKRDPWHVLGLIWMRFWIAVLPVSITWNTTVSIVGAWYAKGVPLLVAVLAVWRLRISAIAAATYPWLLSMFYWLAIQSLAGPGLRYRLPVEPFYACMVGVVGAAVIGTWRRPATRCDTARAQTNIKKS